MNMERLIEKFIGNDCNVELSDRFSYEPTDEVITFTFEENHDSNVEWKKFLKEKFNFTLTAENVFAMSILHELGHHYTVELFSEDVWETEATEKCLGDLTSSERQQAYFNMNIELAATDWAIRCYNCNSKETMRAWNHRFNCAIRHYEKKHHVENSLLTKL